MTSETYPSGALRPAFRRAMWERDGGVRGIRGEPGELVGQAEETGGERT